MNRKILALSIFFIGIGAFSFVLLRQSKPGITERIKPAVKQVLKSKIKWQRYDNPRNGYTIAYPDGWKIEQWDIRDAAKLNSMPEGHIWQQTKFFSPDGKNRYEVIVWENSPATPVRTWLSWYRFDDINLAYMDENPTATISGQPVYTTVQPKTSRKKPLEYYFLNSNGRVYELVFERPDATAGPSGQLVLSANDIVNYALKSFVVRPPQAQ